MSTEATGTRLCRMTWKIRTKDESHVRHATIRALLGFAKPDTLLLSAGFLFGSLAALGMALVPYLSGQVIDYASIDPDRGLFVRSIFLCSSWQG
jgi:hypothetical protein